MAMSEAPPSPADVLAAIDMGSNSFRLEIGQVRDGRYRRLRYDKETVRLGGGLDAQGMLTEEATQRGIACLKRFAESLNGMAASQVRAVATQTLREARNRNAFLARAQKELGYPIEIISGREEARLIYAGVSHLQPTDERRLVVDIGGRSTEIILGDGRRPLAAESFGVGSVSLSMRYFPDGRFTADGFRVAQVAAGAEFEEALEQFAPSLWESALGSSGTAGAVSDILAEADITDGVITPDALRWLIERCLSAKTADKLKLPGLKPERRAVIAGGIAILYTLATHFGIDRLQPAKGALRQGVIVDLHERLLARAEADGRDLRDDSIGALQYRFDVDVRQATRVRECALTLYHAAAPDATVQQRRELGWAADLHELGMMVSHHDHHRHTAYLIAHVDAAGFSQSELRRLGELALAQRGGLRKVEGGLDDVAFARQLFCLRLALILCHARNDVDQDALRLKSHGHNQYELRYTHEWADRHPRTVHLLQEEAACWGRQGPLSLSLPG